MDMVICQKYSLWEILAVGGQVKIITAYSCTEAFLLGFWIWIFCQTGIFIVRG